MVFKRKKKFKLTPLVVTHQALPKILRAQSACPKHYVGQVLAGQALRSNTTPNSIRRNGLPTRCATINHSGLVFREGAPKTMRS